MDVLTNNNSRDKPGGEIPHIQEHVMPYFENPLRGVKLLKDMVTKLRNNCEVRLDDINSIGELF